MDKELSAALKNRTINEAEITALVQEHAALVKRIGCHLIARLPAGIQLEDLLQTGMIALIEAAKNFNPDKGASFETYAGIRVRGMMLDEVRKMDWVPRSVHRNLRKVTQAIRQVEARLGRDAKDHEVAEELNMTLTEYHHTIKDCNATHLYGFEDVGLDDDSMVEGYASNIPGPLEGVQKEIFRDKLSDALGKLPEREKLVLSLYYDEELNLKEIGQVLEVSESRVCQIHSQAMMRLRSRLQSWGD